MTGDLFGDGIFGYDWDWEGGLPWQSIIYGVFAITTALLLAARYFFLVKWRQKESTKKLQEKYKPFFEFATNNSPIRVA